MKKTLLITATAVTAIAAGAAVLLVALETIGGVDDPADAACTQPPTSVSRPRVVLDHREAPVRFSCGGARLTGTMYLPLTEGLHPAVVWIHGSGPQPRLSYGPLVESFVRDGIAFFSYDKRGVGESEGNCCPDEHGHFNLVTADAVGAVAALRTSPFVDPAQVGFVGASAAGWIIPRAAEESGGVAFVAIASPGVLQHGLVARFERETGGAEGASPRPSDSRDRVVEAVRLRSDTVPRTPRRPCAVALRRRRPQRASHPEPGAAALAQAEVRQGLDDRRLPRRRSRPLRRPADRPARRPDGRGLGPTPCRPPRGAARARYFLTSVSRYLPEPREPSFTCTKYVPARGARKARCS